MEQQSKIEIIVDEVLQETFCTNRGSAYFEAVSRFVHEYSYVTEVDAFVKVDGKTIATYYDGKISLTFDAMSELLSRSTLEKQ